MSQLTGRMYHFRSAIIVSGDTWDVFRQEFGPNYGKHPLDRIQSISIRSNREIEFQIGGEHNDWVILRNMTGGFETFALNKTISSTDMLISDLRIRYQDFYAPSKITDPTDPGFAIWNAYVANPLNHAVVDILILPRMDGSTYR